MSHNLSLFQFLTFPRELRAHVVPEDVKVRLDLPERRVPLVLRVHEVRWVLQVLTANAV